MNISDSKAQWLEKQGLKFLGQGIFQDVDPVDWQSYTWQFSHRMRNLSDLMSVLDMDDDQKQAFSMDLGLPVAVTPYYSVLMAKSAPIRRMALPSTHEAVAGPNSMDDPLAEDEYSPVPGLVHRYPDRVLLSTVSTCPVYCRYCTRRRYVGTRVARDRDAWWDYIAAHPGIREVIVSGGEPLSMGNSAISRLLERLRSFDHVQVIRLSTRTPAVLPCRISSNLAKILARFAPVFVLTQFNHPDECTMEAFAAVEKLRRAGVPVVNQAVLLRGVNDDAKIIEELGRRLLIMGVKPYYLHQMDAVTGTDHFRVSLRRGMSIMRQLRASVSGLVAPKYVIDLPHGGGKVPLSPDHVLEIAGRRAWLIGTDNRVHEYSWDDDD